jgi:hypothetical protein
MVQRDYILRMIEQFAQAIAAIVAHLGGGRREEARAAIDQAWVSLGVSRSMVQSLDANSIRMLVGEEKAELVMKLFAVEAELLHSEGKEREALLLEARINSFRPTR